MFQRFVTKHHNIQIKSMNLLNKPNENSHPFKSRENERFNLLQNQN